MSSGPASARRDTSADGSEEAASEQTRFRARSPYGISKVTGFDLARNDREAYGLFVSAVNLFNDDSPRRGFELVTHEMNTRVP